jgi:hypothetical protein
MHQNGAQEKQDGVAVCNKLVKIQNGQLISLWRPCDHKKRMADAILFSVLRFQTRQWRAKNRRRHAYSE